LIDREGFAEQRFGLGVFLGEIESGRERFLDGPGPERRRALELACKCDGRTKELDRFVHLAQLRVERAELELGLRE